MSLENHLQLNSLSASPTDLKKYFDFFRFNFFGLDPIKLPQFVQVAKSKFEPKFEPLPLF